MPKSTLYTGDVLAVLKSLPDQSVQCVVTSPPYWGLRSYLPDAVKIRDDLTPEERAYLESELERRGIRPIGDEV